MSLIQRVRNDIKKKQAAGHSVLWAEYVYTQDEIDTIQANIPSGYITRVTHDREGRPLLWIAWGPNGANELALTLGNDK